LRQTFATGWAGRGRLALAEATDGAKLRIQRGFKYAKDEILGFIVHGGLLSISSKEG
jgi:hypothetical protein